MPYQRGFYILNVRHHKNIRADHSRLICVVKQSKLFATRYVHLSLTIIFSTDDRRLCFPKRSDEMLWETPIARSRYFDETSQKYDRCQNCLEGSGRSLRSKLSLEVSVRHSDQSAYRRQESDEGCCYVLKVHDMPSCLNRRPSAAWSHSYHIENREGFTMLKPSFACSSAKSNRTILWDDHFIQFSIFTFIILLSYVR